MREFKITPCFEKRNIAQQQMQSTTHLVVLHNQLLGIAKFILKVVGQGPSNLRKISNEVTVLVG